MEGTIRSGHALAGVQPKVVGALLLVLGLGAWGLLGLRDGLSASGSGLGGSARGHTQAQGDE